MDEMLRSLSSEEMEVEKESETQGRRNKRKGVESESGTKERNKGAASAGGLVKWEKFLPKMVLRVLLVEADDSTRQIIAALLRKCSYRVAAVPDGLKAWEILKGKPNQIDLILTEVDLPSISGFALLTLIMEHEICKNIPVIMMSSQDSISTVYKCMLRGAADYLVKPIRRNELRNLWQHVWRRQASAASGNGPQDESDARKKVEATAENNATSNHSSGFVACVQRNKECIEKGSDAQSSCTKPDFEAESARMENTQDLSQPILGNSFQSDLKIQNQEAYINSGQKLLMHENEATGPQLGAFGNANTTTQGMDVKPDNWKRDANIAGEACDDNDVLINSSREAIINSSREAIDFIGAFNDYPNYSYRNIISKFDSSPQLDLSLRRSHPGGFDNQATEERHTLRHSDASAFTRYINRPMQPPQQTLAGVCYQEKEHGSNSENFLSNFCTGHNFDMSSPSLGTQKSVIALAADQSKQSEVATSCTQQRVFPVSVPVRGIRFDNQCTGNGSTHSPIFCTQSGTSSLLSPSSASQQESSFRVNHFHQTKFENSNCEQLCKKILQNSNNSTSQTGHKLEHKLDSLEDHGRVSAATNQSASSSLCNGGVSHLNSIGYGSFCGSNSNVDQVAAVKDDMEGKNEENLLTNDGNSQRSIQREAALMKFRLKRKDRCYEKKVRYESRKKLAEQRPRVKGQFVRQVQLDHPPAETENHHGHSYDD